MNMSTAIDESNSFRSNGVVSIVDILSRSARTDSQGEGGEQTLESLTPKNIRNLPIDYRSVNEGRHQRRTADFNASTQIFKSIVLVLTVVEPYESQTEYYQSECTGIFVSRHVVLTLPDCVKGKDLYDVNPEPSYTEVYTQAGYRRKSFKIHVYSNAKNERLYAAIVLETGLDPEKKIEFPKLPSESLDIDKMKESCSLVGFGGQDRLKVTNFRARPLSESRVSEVRCRDRDHWFCLHFSDLQACRGDMGSPLICDGVLYALYAPERFQPLHRCVDRFVHHFLPLAPAREWVASVVAPSALAWFSNKWYVLITCLAVLAVISAIYYVLAVCVIRPFNRHVDRQLTFHMQSLESDEFAAVRRRFADYSQRRGRSIISEDVSAWSKVSSSTGFFGKVTD